MSKDIPSAPASPRLEPPRTPVSPLTPTRRRHVPSDSDVSGPTGQDVLLFLIGSRLLNALIIQTFFQPDEYFQALEPAWAWAFGRHAGAWITWEWKEHLRSAIHPSLFAACYVAANYVSEVLYLSAPYRARLLLAAPKVLQALIAALGDYYTWRLAETTYGLRSLAPAAALVLTVANPWQWFCSTRTFSNSLETTLTIIALYNWPWHWSTGPGSRDVEGVDLRGLRKRKIVSAAYGSVDETTRLRRALLFAAFATILRPTNVLIWLTLVVLMILQSLRTTTDNAAKEFDIPRRTLRSGLSLRECIVFLREAILCGSAVLALSAVVDRLFYQTWTFPAWHFLQVNVLQSIAGFYGNNNWHYYLSQGYPLLLTTALPFAMGGMYQSCFGDRYRNLSPTARFTLYSLTAVSLILPATLSLISHKEVRFIYPLLPGLHILAAHPTASFFTPAFDSLRPYSRGTQISKRLLLAFLLITNLSISLYTASIHNSGLITVTHHLRQDFETYHLLHPTSHNMTVGFLMPCHSTPWRSHLQYPPTASQPGIDAWALTCEPPLGMTHLEKANYLDEADQFYIDPEVWLKRHMSRGPPTAHFPTTAQNHDPGVFAPAKPRRVFNIETHNEEYLWREKRGRRPWPEYLVFFEQLEPQMKRLVGKASGYAECARVWNSHGHDDWRRKGDLVVWCLYPERRRGNERGRQNLKEMEERVRAGKEGRVDQMLGTKEDMERVGGWGLTQRPLNGLMGDGAEGMADLWEWMKGKTGFGRRKTVRSEVWGRAWRVGGAGGHWD